MEIIQPKQPRPAPKERPTTTLGDPVSNPQDYPDGVWYRQEELENALSDGDFKYFRTVVIDSTALCCSATSITDQTEVFATNSSIYTLLTDTPIFGIDLEQARTFGEVDND